MSLSCQEISNKCYEVVETYILPQDKKELLCAVTALGLTFICFEGAAVAGACYLGYKTLYSEKLSDPSEVQKIYTPVSYNSTDWEPYQGQLEEIKKRADVIGATFILTRDNQTKVPVYITREQAEGKCVEVFRAILFDSNQQVGFAEINPYTEENQFLENFWMCGVPEYIEDDMYGKGVSKVILNQVTNRQADKYKQVGVVLIKAVQEAFMKDCECRMHLEAVRATQPYYYSLGFRTYQAEEAHMNKTCQKMVHYGKRFTRDMGAFRMCLPDRARELWKNEIQQHPILFSDK